MGLTAVSSRAPRTPAVRARVTPGAGKGVARVRSPQAPRLWFENSRRPRTVNLNLYFQFASRVRPEEIASNSLSAEFITSKYSDFLNFPNTVCRPEFIHLPQTTRMLGMDGFR